MNSMDLLKAVEDMIAELQAPVGRGAGIIRPLDPLSPHKLISGIAPYSPRDLPTLSFPGTIVT
jgi:hypothetical protein